MNSRYSSHLDIHLIRVISSIRRSPTSYARQCSAAGWWISFKNIFQAILLFYHYHVFVMYNAVKSMYKNSKTSMKVNGVGGRDFPVEVGVHQGSMLSTLS